MHDNQRNVCCLYSSPRCETEKWSFSYSHLNKLSFLLHISDLPQLWCVIIISFVILGCFPTYPLFIICLPDPADSMPLALCCVCCQRSEPIAVIIGTTPPHACPTLLASNRNVTFPSISWMFVLSCIRCPPSWKTPIKSGRSEKVAGWSLPSRVVALTVKN